MITTRLPISTYHQALWRLVEHFETHGVVIAPREELPVAAQIVSEIFWVSLGRMRADLISAQRQLRGFAPERKVRR